MNEMEEQKKANLETSCCNMQNKLVKIENIVTVAMANQPERVGENWQHLSKALADIRQLCKDPFEYVTPKAVVDAIKAGELPFGGSRAVEPEIEPVAKHDWLELPRGITLKRFRNTGRATTFLGQYDNTANTANPNPLRVYKIEVRPVHPEAEPGTPKGKVFFVDVIEDSKLLFTISTERGRSIAEHLGVKALKAWLGFLIGDKRRGKEAKKRHRKRNKANRRKAEGSNAEAQGRREAEGK